MRTIICGGSLIVTGAGVVFLLTLAAHSFGSPLPGAGLGQELCEAEINSLVAYVRQLKK
jgi:hypothetical protein